MQVSFHVRNAVGSDAAEIARLSAELGYPASVEEISSRLARLLPQSAQFIAVAAGPERLLGWVQTERRMLLESGEKAEIVGLVVGVEARRAGVGRALVLAAERWAYSQRLGTVVVRSNIVRAESHPFYEGIGYERRKTQHTYAKVLRGDRQGTRNGSTPRRNAPRNTPSG